MTKTMKSSPKNTKTSPQMRLEPPNSSEQLSNLSGDKKYKSAHDALDNIPEAEIIYTREQQRKLAGQSIRTDEITLPEAIKEDKPESIPIASANTKSSSRLLKYKLSWPKMTHESDADLPPLAPFIIVVFGLFMLMM
jgi:hypothetical protein